MGGVAHVCYNTVKHVANHSHLQPFAFYRDGTNSHFDLDLPFKKLSLFDNFKNRNLKIAHSLCHRTLSVKADYHIYTVHDVWSFKKNSYQSDSYSKKIGQRMIKEIQKADHVVAISQTTLNNLLEYEIIAPEKCSCIHLGVELLEKKKNFQNPALKSLLNLNFVLFVGCLEIRKNISHLLEAVYPFSDLHLVIAGSPGYEYDETIKPLLGKFPQERLHVIHKVERSDLAYLYEAAFATLYPTWEEGFGLPILEAMVHGSPMITSNRSANAEIGGEGAILRNKDEEPFMERYAPTAKDLAPRDLISRAIIQEIREGRGLFHEGHNAHHVWLDLRHLPKEVHEKRIQEVCSFFKRFVGVDPERDLCPVTPTAHYQMGGIPTSEFGEVRNDTQGIVPGLFACGEIAAASLHGLNRLGTNSLLELITMGRVTGDRVVEYLKDATDPEGPSPDEGHMILDQFSTYIHAQGREKYAQIRDKLRDLMMEKVGIFRTEKSLSEAIEELNELKERAIHIPQGTKSLRANQDLWEVWELNNLITVSTVITQGALSRNESRGAHFREDYPERSDEFNYHTLVYMPKFGKITLDKRPIDMSIFKDKREHYELFDYIKREY